MPAAMAITFLSAPAELHAHDVVAGVRAEGRGWRPRAAPPRRPPASAEATTTVVGWPCATSSANDGPESTASGLAGQLLRRHLAHAPQRVELEALGGGDERPRPRRSTRRAARGRRRGRTPTAPPRARVSAPATAAREVGGRGQRRGQGDARAGSAALLARSLISRAPAPASRTHSRTSWPARARCAASAVPHEPAPTTAILTARPRRAARPSGARCRGRGGGCSRGASR